MKNKPKIKRQNTTLSPEEIILKQNRVIISLLTKQVFGEEKIKQIITKDKRKGPEAYVKGYNACDGTRSVNDLAKVVGVTAGTLSPVLQDWEKKGLIYDVGNPSKPLYVRLINLK